MENFLAKVVDVNDPEKSGRLKIRIFGIHDDTTTIPDSDLPWASCIFPVTNPVHNGVASCITGAVPGTIVIGKFADEDKQIPLIEGSLGRNSDAFKDSPKTNSGEDINQVLDEPIIVVGQKETKYKSSSTIGGIKGKISNIMLDILGIEESNYITAVLDIKSSFRTIDAITDTIESIGDIAENDINSILMSLGLDKINIDIDLGFIDELIEIGGNIIDKAGAGDIVENKTETNNLDHLTSDIAGDNLELDSKNNIKRIMGSLKFIDGTVIRSVDKAFDSIKKNAKRKDRDG